MREELKLLVALADSTSKSAGVLKVFGWYERRVAPSTPRHPPVVEVSIATELMLGGDLLQRACVSRYSEHHVRSLARHLLSAVGVLAASGVEAIDLAPWSLLYSAPSASAPLDKGLVITNAGFGAPRAVRSTATPLRAAFDPPEAASTPGASRGVAAAVWTLGRLLRLLLTGTVERGDALDAALSAPPAAREDVAISPEAAVMLEALCASAPDERPSLSQIHELEWMAARPPAKPPGGLPAKAAAAAKAEEEAAKAEDPPLAEAQEALNRWYDAFLFEAVRTFQKEDSDCFWLLRVASDCFRLLLVASGCFWSLLIVPDRLGLLLIASDCFHSSGTTPSSSKA